MSGSIKNFEYLETPSLLETEEGWILKLAYSNDFNVSVMIYTNSLTFNKGLFLVRKLIDRKGNKNETV